jgi:hypothetical protein
MSAWRSGAIASRRPSTWVDAQSDLFILRGVTGHIAPEVFVPAFAPWPAAQLRPAPPDSVKSLKSKN